LIIQIIGFNTDYDVMRTPLKSIHDIPPLSDAPLFINFAVLSLYNTVLAQAPRRCKLLTHQDHYLRSNSCVRRASCLEVERKIEPDVSYGPEKRHFT